MVRLRATLLNNYYTNTKLNEYTGPTEDCFEPHKKYWFEKLISER